ncbi:MAG: iron ABC transporter permease [Oscillospiraceae bacterium]
MVEKLIKRKKEERFLQTGTKRKLIWASALALFIIISGAVTLGNFTIPFKSVFAAIWTRLGFGSVEDNNFLVIVCDVRLPRIILAALGGMGIAMSGTVFQGVFRNPLVEPYVLGISSGAAFGAALSIVFLNKLVSVGLMAFVFAVAAMAMSYSIATKQRQTPLVNLILSGMIVGSIFTALLNLVKTMAPDSKLREITFWLMGGFYTATWQDVLFLLPTVLLSLLILWKLAWRLNVLSVGEQEARSLGINVGALKIVLLGISTFLTASIVSRAGIISWVGLMIPHAARMLLGPDHRFLIPFAAFLGGTFLVICDTIARTVIMGEIPISIITSILGAPYLIYLIRKNRQVSLG